MFSDRLTTTSDPSDHDDEDLCDHITWLEVEYQEKDQCKAAGGRWDAERRQWYAPMGADLTKLRPWVKRRIHLNCAFQEKEAAKSRGARWDAMAGKWYITEPGMDRTQFAEWLPV